jgi:hypothetical protein
VVGFKRVRNTARVLVRRRRLGEGEMPKVVMGTDIRHEGFGSAWFAWNIIGHHHS